MLPQMSKWYWGLAVLRVVLVLIPQLGYIHPDEYFQSLEVFAARAFDLESNPPWEFNSTAPIRSVTIPYFTVGLLYGLINTIDLFFKQYLTTTVLTTYLLVVAPRLLICFLSFIVDFCLWKICDNNNEKYKSKLVILASSYVILIYGTRTFSNTTELILFALLLYYVSDSLVFSNIVIKQREYINYRYETSKSVTEKVQFHKLRLCLASDSLRNCPQISTITVFGFFNRPTFVAFAVFPVFFWLYRGIGTKLVAPMNYHSRIIYFILCCIPSILLNVVMDSFFYSYITWGEVGMLAISINNFVFTPLNFVKYNIDAENLAQHGLHPRFLHILVNMPLLFNALAIFAFFAFIKTIYNLFRGKHQLLPTVRSIRGLMMLSYIAPLLLLSIFPHQEPRFIIPLIVPLVYLYGGNILQESDNVLIKSENASQAQSKPPGKTSKDLISLWLSINTLLVIFYGFLHQGGVFLATDYLAKDMRVKSATTEYHIVTSHIYSIPQTLFLQKSSDKLYFAKTTKYAINKRMFLYEEGSLDLDLLLEKIHEVFRRIHEVKMKVKPKQKYKVFLIIASSLADELNELKSDLRFIEVASFYPHISTEAFPNISEDLLMFYNNFKLDEFPNSLLFYLYKIGSAFGLKLYEISL